MTDPIADMLTRIRNAIMVKHQQVVLPHSSLKEHLANKLHQLGYLGSVSVDKQAGHSQIVIDLVYKNGQPLITSIKRISKPGRRLYYRADKIRPTLSGHGATVISTSQGLLSDKEARQAGVGGEIICQVY